MAVVYKLASGAILLVPDTTKVAIVNPTDLPIVTDTRSSDDFAGELLKYASPRSRELAKHVANSAKQIDPRIVIPESVAVKS